MNYKFWKKLRDYSNHKLNKFGGWTKCPNCNRKSYEADTVWKDVGKYTFITCTGCNHTSKWIDGPGLMLHVGN